MQNQKNNLSPSSTFTQIPIFHVYNYSEVKFLSSDVPLFLSFIVIRSSEQTIVFNKLDFLKKSLSATWLQSSTFYRGKEILGNPYLKMEQVFLRIIYVGIKKLNRKKEIKNLLEHQRQTCDKNISIYKRSNAEYIF